MTQSFEERWGVYCNGEIVDPIPFIKEEISQAKKEERERIRKLLNIFTSNGLIPMDFQTYQVMFNQINQEDNQKELK
jgi:hypothetical protein